MTPEQRQQEFNQLFDALPGKNIDKIRAVCATLHLRENTVRLYRLDPKARGVRIIPERSLKILRDRLGKDLPGKALPSENRSNA